MQLFPCSTSRLATSNLYNDDHGGSFIASTNQAGAEELDVLWTCS